MTAIAKIGQKDDGRAWLAACMATIATAPTEDRLSVLKAQAAEGAQIIRLGLLEKQTVVDRFAQIAHSAGFVDEFGPDAVQDALVAFGGAQPAQSARPLSFVKASSFEGQPIPVRAWHVENLIPAGNVTLLNGDGGTGKSLIALQLGVATTTAGRWIGRDVQPGVCLFLTAEDDLAEVHRRLADIAAEDGIALADLDRLMIVSLAGDDALLAVPDGRSNIIRPTGLFGALESLIEKTRPALVVLDTLADLFGGEENQRAQARQFVGMLRGLAINYQAALLLLAHPSLAGMASGSGSSGSTGWNNSVRSRLYLERIKGGDGSEDDPDARVLKTMKANYAAVGAQVRLRWSRGVFVAEGAASVSSFSAIAAEAHADRIFIDLVAKYAAEGRHVSATASSNYAPALFEKDQRSDGVKKRGFTMAMNRLFEAGRIKVEEFGPPSRRLKRIAVVTAEASE
jgi:RecA-family ATPase